MNKQTVEFVVQKKHGIVTATGKSYITHPGIHFSGGSIKWYEDRPRQQYSNTNG